MFGSLMEEFDNMDIWTTKPHVDKNWNEVEVFLVVFENINCYCSKKKVKSNQRSGAC